MERAGSTSTPALITGFRGTGQGTLNRDYQGKLNYMTDINLEAAELPLSRLEKALQEATAALKEYKETTGMLTLEKPMIIERPVRMVSGQTSNPDLKQVKKAYAEYWKLTVSKGLVGLANELVTWELSAENLIALFLLGIGGGPQNLTWQKDWASSQRELAFPKCLEPDFYLGTDGKGPKLPKVTELGSSVMSGDLAKPVSGLLYYGFGPIIRIVVAERLSVSEQLQVIKFLENAYLDYPGLPEKNGLVFKRLSGGKIEVEEKPI